MGICIFGGSTAQLRYADEDSTEKGSLVISTLDGMFDGGDGAVTEDDEGLKRGEC